MQHEAISRPEASDIIDTIAEAMRVGVERLDRDYKIVPSIFEVYLHPDAFDVLEPIVPMIQERAAVRLDRELERLNEGGALGRVQRLLDPERADLQPYRRVGSRWVVKLFPSHDPDVEPDSIAVAAELATPDETDAAGPQTRRLTMRVGNDKYQTRRLGEDEAGTHTAPPTSPASSAETHATARTVQGREERVGEGRQPLARLDFTDDSGARTVLLTATETAIGRRDEGYEWVEIQLDTVDDVSREHLRIRCNREAGRFEIKDLSTFGTTVAEPGGEAQQVPSSLDPETDRDLDRWVPLPHRAVIGLADALFLKFESLL